MSTNGMAGRSSGDAHSVRNSSIIPFLAGSVFNVCSLVKLPNFQPLGPLPLDLWMPLLLLVVLADYDSSVPGCQ
jgi:hypothetical protein